MHLIGLQDELRSGEVFGNLPWLTIRAGAHTGDAHPVDDDYVEYAVNVAARIASAANAGQLLCSYECADEMSSAVGELVGSFAFKDIADPGNP